MISTVTGRKTPTVHRMQGLTCERLEGRRCLAGTIGTGIHFSQGGAGRSHSAQFAEAEVTPFRVEHFRLVSSVNDSDPLVVQVEFTQPLSAESIDSALFQITNGSNADVPLGTARAISVGDHHYLQIPLNAANDALGDSISISALGHQIRSVSGEHLSNPFPRVDAITSEQFHSFASSADAIFATEESWELPALGNPQDSAVVDRYDDGIADIASVDLQSRRVLVTDAVGNGRFGAADAVATLPDGIFPWAVHVVDWNGDGIDDLAIGASESGFVNGYVHDPQILLYLGDLDGAYTLDADSPILLEQNSNPTVVAFADVVGDADLDIIHAWNNYLNPSDSSVMKVVSKDRFLGYTTQLGIEGVDKVKEIMVADINRDGSLDLVTNDIGFEAGMTMHLSDSEGGFGGSQPIRLGVTDSGFYTLDEGGSGRVADINQDGNLDIVGIVDVFSNFADVYDGNVLITLLGDGEGSFQRHGYQRLNRRGMELRDAKDHNGDGTIDLVVVASPWEEDGFETTPDWSTWLMTGDGTASFTPSTPNPIPIPDASSMSQDEEGAFQLYDLDGDGFLDAVESDADLPRIRISKGSENGYSLSQDLFGWTNPFEQSADNRLVIDDINADGFTDYLLLITNFSDRFVLVVNGSPSGPVSSQFVAVPDLDFRREGWLSVADVDSDGRKDLLVGGYGGLSVILADSRGDFVSTNTVKTRINAIADYEKLNGRDRPAMDDVNGDGFLDLVVGVTRPQGTFNVPSPVGYITAFGDGTGQFFPNANTLVEVSVGGPLNSFFSRLSMAPELADINGDMKQDLVVGGISQNGSGIHAYLGAGNGSFANPLFREIAGASHSTVRLAELNGDGTIDALFVTRNGSRFDVALGIGDGTFAAPISLRDVLAINETVSGLSIQDVDGDGDNDLALTLASRSELITLINDGLAGFSLGLPVSMDGEIFRFVLSPSISSIDLGTLNTRLAASSRLNSLNPHDVNGDGDVSPIDALLVINFLARTEDHSVSQFDPGPYFYDVNNNHEVSPIDALRVINYIARLSITAPQEYAEPDSQSASAGLPNSRESTLEYEIKADVLLLTDFGDSLF
ncbi:MAG: hypothetical protein F9B45_19660 [Phycisphaera sp. RhM]|nr:hypothetical protein [Phycisphaera sp. RhM]